MTTDNRSIRVAVGRSSPAEAGSPAAHPEERRHEPGVTCTPPIDIHEGPEGLVLEADLPGVSEDHLVIQLEDNVLSLYAKVSAPAPEGARPLYEEYRVG